MIRIEDGDQEAFVTLYRRCQPALFRFCLRMTGSRAASEDVIQDLFLEIFRRPGRYQASRGTVESYLFGIARKLMQRQFRRKRRQVPLEADNQNSPPAPEACCPADAVDTLIQSEEIAALRRAVLALPVRYREVVVLCEMESLSYAQAAEILRCPVGTIRSRLHRARGLLLQRLRLGRKAGSAETATISRRCPT